MNTLLIDGQWLSGEGEWMVSRNPCNHNILWKKRGADQQQVVEAVAAARQAQSGWAQRPLMERCRQLNHFADLLQLHKKDLAHVIALETGKSLTECLAEVSAMVNKVQLSLRSFQQRTGDWFRDGQALQHKPLGVVLVLGPFNFPGHLPNGQIVPALLAGNAVVFKPSEETPWVAERTVQLWQDAGLPAGVLNLVHGGPDIAEVLCEQPLDGIFFTGSSTTGRQLHAQMAGRPEVLLAMEMGGNNPLIVDQGVNSDVALDLIIQSAYVTAGQRCTCARRLIVVESPDSNALIADLTRRVKQLDSGAPMLTMEAPSEFIHDPESLEPPDWLPQVEPFMGPVINMAAKNRLLGAQARLRSLGAHTLVAMKALDDHSGLLTPGLMDMTIPWKRGVEIPDEEWFGPLLQVYRVANIESALSLANRTRFGLAAGLISNNAMVQQRFRQHIRAGVISINAPTAGASSELPFGGIGASGNHRPGAWYTADSCVWPQAVRMGASCLISGHMDGRCNQAS